MTMTAEQKRVSNELALILVESDSSNYKEFLKGHYLPEAFAGLITDEVLREARNLAHDIEHDMAAQIFTISLQSKPYMSTNRQRFWSKITTVINLTDLLKSFTNKFYRTIYARCIRE